MLVLSISIALAFVVSAYSLGIFSPNVDRIVLTSGRLIAGVSTDNITISATSSILVDLKNPSYATNVTELELSENALPSSIKSWSTTSDPQPSNSLMVDSHNLVAAGTVTVLTLYPVSSPPVTITNGESYYYVIDFSNGQSVSGFLVAQ